MKHTVRLMLMATAIAAAAPAAFAANADCPNDGIVRFGVEPFDTSAKLVPIYDHIGKLLGEKIGCEVKIYVTTNYNAEIEAMRNGKLEIGEFGPLGYVLAHQVAKAEAVAAFANKDGKPDSYWASLVTYARLRHQDGRRDPRPFLRVLRSRPPPPATCSRPMACARPASIRTRTSRRSTPAATRRRSRRCTTTRSTPAN